TEVNMTAMTNKAAEVLSQATGRPTSTIHSHLGLKVIEDYETGAMKLQTTRNTSIHSREIIFIDEASMIDKKLRQFLKQLVDSTCKIVYVCDDRQLAPIGEDLSVIFKEGHEVIELTEQMRSNGSSSLMALHEQLRESVLTKKFLPNIAAGKVIIHITDGGEADNVVNDLFGDPEHKGRILAYSNKTVLEYNDHIRQLRGLPPLFTAGEHLVCNTSFPVRNIAMKRNIAVEEQITLTEIDEKIQLFKVFSSHGSCEIEYQNAKILDAFGNEFAVKLAVDRTHLAQVVRWLANRKDWVNYFDVKENFPDFRMRDACTVHKAQGSTYDFAFIDADNLSRCNDPNTAARLLYVAVSRAKHRVYLYGQLAAKYGGIRS